MNTLPTLSTPQTIDFRDGSGPVLVEGFSVGDVDGDILTVTLSTAGILAFGQTSGLTFIVGDGTGQSTLTFSGSVADINAALATLTYMPANGATFTPDTISISVDDGGQTQFLGEFAATIGLNEVVNGDGSIGFAINGIDGGDLVGTRISDAGDINGDGIDDIMISAPLAALNGVTGVGETYVVFGSDSGFPSVLELSDLNGQNGFVIRGINAGDESGTDISRAGDFNGDGIDDFIIGSPMFDSGGEDNVGQTYIVFGTRDGFGATLDLASVDGQNGIVINGRESWSMSGYSVDTIGDFNGDGFSDIVIGAPGDSDSGAAYIIFGSDQPFAPGFGADWLNGQNGFVLKGTGLAIDMGVEQSSAGDFNGDGFDDVMLRVENVDGFSDVIVILYGRTGNFAPSLDYGDITADDGLIITGGNSSSFGRQISSLGDVNGDGFNDVIIGSPSENGGNGRSYVVFGGVDHASGSFFLGDLDGTNGFSITGHVLNGISGGFVSDAGDINGDGFDDILVGAQRIEIDGNRVGETYVVFGRADGFDADINLATLDGTSGFSLIGEGDTRWSGIVSAAGDLNGDGIDDLIIGAPQTDVDGRIDAGQAYVLYGRGEFGPSVATGSIEIVEAPDNYLPTLTLADGFTIDEDSGAIAVSGMSVADRDGDVLTVTLSAQGLLSLGVLEGLTFTTGDGDADTRLVFSGAVADINAALDTLTYAPIANDDNGDTISVEVTDGSFLQEPGIFTATNTIGSTISGDRVNFVFGSHVSGLGDINNDGFDDAYIGGRIIYGSADGVPAQFDLASLDGTNGFTVTDGARGTYAGDVNGDGIDDFIVSNLTATVNGVDGAGQAYLVFGREDGFDATFDVDDLDGTNGFSISGFQRFGILGSSLSAIGDINDDGIDDFAVGAYGYEADNFEPYAGAVLVIYGSTDGFDANINLNDFDSDVGFLLNGTFWEVGVGRSITALGDINGDGIDDFAAGGSGANDGVSSAGQTFVVFGTRDGFPNELTYRDFDGINGFIIQGINDYDAAGDSISSAGDFNGDGFMDIIIGATGVDRGADLDYGAAYIVFGSDQGFGPRLNLGDLDGTNGITLEANRPGDRVGVSVSYAGDINGDGMDDVIIGATGGGFGRGAAYILFGTTGSIGNTWNPSGSEFTLELLDGNNGFEITGPSSGALMGSAVSYAGDLNGDGFDDLIVDAPGAAEAYIIYGRANFVPGSDEGTIIININPENDAPEITGDLAGFLSDGAAYRIGITDLFAFDVDDSDSVLTVNASDVINGTLLVRGIESTTFTLSDIVNGNVFFQHDTEALGDGQFSVTVTDDDGLSSTVSTFSIRALGPITRIGTDEADTIVGSQGNDIIEGGASGDTLDGGLGRDTLSYASSSSGVTINLAIGFADRGDAAGDIISNFEDLVGSGFNDTLLGDDGNNVINGGDGADIMEGRGGIDTLSYVGSSGGVTINLQNNFTRGGDAQGDRFTGFENITGSDFGDTLIGDNITNILLGGGGGDKLFGYSGNDTINGGDGGDRIVGHNGDDIINGEAGNDWMYGLSDDDTITGGDGNDNFFGGTGTNTMSGDGGNDRFFIDTGGSLDTIDGGDGDDRVVYRNFTTQAVTIDLLDQSLNAGAAAGHTLTNIETIDGTQLADTILGSNTGRDKVFGWDGDDVIDGRDGDDLIWGVDGDDTLNGGAGFDQLRGGSGNDIIDGGDGDDLLDGGADDDTMFGGAGIDKLIGNTGNDTLHGGDGDDRVTGQSGDDILNGDAGDDDVLGADGDDILNGGTGDDFMRGGNDDDVLTGGAGADVMYGDAGADTFVFEAGDSVIGAEDLIRRFETADTIEIAGHTFVDSNAFSGSGSFEVRYESTAAATFIEMDRDGDGTADERIDFDGNSVWTFVSDGTDITGALNGPEDAGALG